MVSYTRHDYDVLVIGAGGAGLRACIEAANAGVSVGLICKSLHGKAHTVILKGPDELEARAVADVRQARIPMAAEVALEDAPVLRPIEDGAPRFELAHTVRRFLRVQLRHPPVVHVLAAPHRVGEVDLPAVAVVHVGERRRDPPFGHHRVGLAEE